MKAVSTRFLGLPRTALGWWAAGLGVTFVTLFLLVSNDIIHFSGILTISLGVLAGITDLVALIHKHERSWLVWFMLLPGLFAIILPLVKYLLLISKPQRSGGIK